MFYLFFGDIFIDIHPKENRKRYTKNASFTILKLLTKFASLAYVCIHFLHFQINPFGVYIYSKKLHFKLKIIQTKTLFKESYKPVITHFINNSLLIFINKWLFDSQNLFI